MRKKFVLYVLIPVIIVSIIVYIYIDSWIEAGLEYGGERAVGARVEIDNLHMYINPITIQFSRLQVANPNDGWYNMFETGKVKFALNFGQLLRGKYIIETVEVNDLILGTKRTSDGSFPKPKPISAGQDSTGQPVSPLTEDAKTALAPEDTKSSASFDLDKIKRELKIDSLLDPKNLLTYRQIDSLKKQINDAGIQWKETLAEVDRSKEKLADIETRTKAINVGSIKTIQDAAAATNNVKAILNNANEVKNSFNAQKSMLTGSVNKFGSDIKDLDNLVERDLKNAISMARLPDVSMQGMAEMLFGKDLLQKAYEYLGYVEMAKSKIQNSSDKPPIETPARLKGQNIHFAIDRAYPKFWIKNIKISGGTDRAQDPQYFYAKGLVQNVTNDQHITGYPLTVNLNATKGGTTSLTLDAIIDRRKEIPVDNYKARLTGLAVSTMSLGRSDFLPSQITSAIADAAIEVEVPGRHFDSNTKIGFNNLNLLFEQDPKGIVEKIVHDVLASVKGFNVDLRIWKNEDKFDIAFTTDLDEQLASLTKKVIGGEIEKIKKDLRNKLNAKIAEKRAEVEKLYNEKRETIMAKVKEYENMVNEKLAAVESKKKEIENRVDQEKKKKTGDASKKAKDALKGIFK